MPSALRRLPEAVTLTCSQYELHIDEADREAFATDPVEAVRKLIYAADAPGPNAIIIDDAAREVLGANDAGAGPPPLVVHVDSPPSHASRYIIFVS